MLDQKVALVTGASRGIGRSIALRLARQGFFVVVNYRGAQTRAQGVLDEIENAGGQGRIYPCDVASETDVKTMIETIVKQYGRLDVVVNNAGVTKDNLILRMKAEDLDLVLDTNLKGTFYCMKYAAKQMLRSAQRPYHQYFFDCRDSWKCGAGQLQRFQGRDYRHDEIAGEGAGQPGDHSERGRSWIY